METTESTDKLPFSYLVWLGAVGLSFIGNSALYFALAWSASLHGAAVVGFVMVAVLVPRACLLLFGGAAADRHGARRLLIASDAVMLVVTAALAGAAHWMGEKIWLMVSTALVTGLCEAVSVPALQPLPQRLVTAGQLPRARVLRQLVGQLSMTLGGVAGGLIYWVGGLSAVALVDSATFAAILAVTYGLRPKLSDVPLPPQLPLGRLAIDGARELVSVPGLRELLVLTGLAAGFFLPVGSMLVPVLAHVDQWGVVAAGIAVACVSLGLGAVILVAVPRSLIRPSGAVAASGVGLAGLGALCVGAIQTLPAVLIGTTVMGAGMGVFTASAGKLILGQARPDAASRTQAVVTVSQSIPLIVTTASLGVLASVASPGSAVVVCAAMLLAAGLISLSLPAVRNAGH